MKALFLALALISSPLLTLACGGKAAATSSSAVEEHAVFEAADALPVLLASAATLSTPRTCHDHINCPPGDRCVNGVCVVQPLCTYDWECGPGGRCAGGRCR